MAKETICLTKFIPEPRTKIIYIKIWILNIVNFVYTNFQRVVNVERRLSEVVILDIFEDGISIQIHHKE